MFFFDYNPSTCRQVERKFFFPLLSSSDDVAIMQVLLPNEAERTCSKVGNQKKCSKVGNSTDNVRELDDHSLWGSWESIARRRRISVSRIDFGKKFLLTAKKEH